MNNGSTSGIWSKAHAPKNAAMTAGIPNFNRTLLSAFFPTKIILKILLKKCTTPVKAIAKSTGKKIMKIGVRIVPSPKPEKKVSIATKNAAKDIIIISNVLLFYKLEEFTSYLTQSR